MTSNDAAILMAILIASTVLMVVLVVEAVRLIVGVLT